MSGGDRGSDRQKKGGKNGAAKPDPRGTKGLFWPDWRIPVQASVRRLLSVRFRVRTCGAAFRPAPPVSRRGSRPDPRRSEPKFRPGGEL